MNDKELKRLEKIEERVKEIALEEGLMAKDIIFEIVPAERVMEVSSYALPESFSHWTHGRDFERTKTIYSHTGHGVAYEIVCNVDPIRAFLIETNPFSLNALILAHCFGHMDMYLANEHCKQQNKFNEMGMEAKLAAKRFERYASIYGFRAVEEVLDAALSVQMHQNPDLFFDEPSEEAAREFLLKMERAQFQPSRDVISEFQPVLSEEDIGEIDDYLFKLSKRTPPIATYNILHYLTSQTRAPLEDWIRDILNFVNMQWRYFRSQINTKLLHEGWATYWHRKIFLQLFAEGLITEEEHGEFVHYDAGVRAESKTRLNPYRVGHALFEYIEDRWNKGQFGPDYEDCTDPYKRYKWDTATNQGKEKIFEVRRFYNDRMAIEEFMTDDFIREQKIFLFSEVEAKDGSVKDIIDEVEPRMIRESLKRAYALHGIPSITVEDGNYRNGGLYLLHHWTGYELDPDYRDRVLEKLFFLWGRPIFLETRIGDKLVLFTYNGNNKKEKVKVEVING